MAVIRRRCAALVWSEGRDCTYALFTHAGEAMTRAGVILFIAALLAWIRRRGVLLPPA